MNKTDDDAMDFKARVRHVVAQIPAGRVASYGQIAHLAGAPRAARAVGNILKGLQDPEVIPWQRVLNARGAISARGDLTRASRQRSLLKREGIHFEEGAFACDLETFEWSPEETFWAIDWGEEALDAGDE